MSGRRADFVDFENGIIYELKPTNPRAIREGKRQLKNYLEEIEKIEQYKQIKWQTVLELY